MLSSFSVKKPYTIIVSVIAVIILGVVSFSGMSTDLLPNMELPIAAIITVCPGSSPEKVETGATRPIEAAVATTGGVETITSTSSENLSMVILEFSQGTNLDSAIIELDGKLGLASLDDAAGTPEILRLNPDMLPLFVASIDVEGQDILQTSALAENELIPALERVNGVASVDAMGLVESQIQIRLDPDKIDALNEKVLASVDESLAQAQQKLDEAQAELEEQKQALTEQTGQQTHELNNAGIQLTDGKTQLLTAQSVLQLLEDPLDQITNRLIALREDVDGELEEALPQIESTHNTVSSLLGVTRTAASNVSQQLDAARTQLESAQEELQTLQALEDPTPIETARIQVLQAQILSLRQQIDGLEESLPTLRSLTHTLSLAAQQLTAIWETAYALNAGDVPVNDDGEPADDLLAELVNTLDEGISTLEGLRTELPQQQAQLADTLADLTEKQLQLEDGKSEISQAIAQASAAITAGETALQEQQAQFDLQSESAYQQADLSGKITEEMLAGILAANNFSMPAGYLTEGTEQYAVKVGDAFSSLEEVEELILLDLTDQGIGPVRLSDVATVEETDNAGEMYAKINGNDGILVTFMKQSTASTTEVSAGIREAIQSLEDAYPGVHITALSDQGVYIDIVIRSVLSNLLMGGLLAVVILFCFLRRFRPTFLVAVSIPISVTFAIVLMYFTGVTINIISLAGLALGIGMLVDNSIVVIENIYRLRAEGVSPREAAVQGASQVAGAIAASTLTTICVFLPIVFVEGITRQLFADIGLTIAYSLVASLLVAMTLVPALSSMGSSRDGAGVSRELRPQPRFDRFLEWYGRGLSWSLRHRAVVLSGAALLLAVSLFGASVMGTAFMPETDEQQLSVTLTMPTDATTDETREMSDRAAALIQEVPGVETVGAMQGGGLMGMGTGSGNSVSMYVLLSDKRSQTSQEIASAIESATADLPCEVRASGGATSLLSMAGSGLDVEITGPDLDTLRAVALDIAELLSQTEGTAAIDNGLGDPAPEIRITVDKEKAMGYGLTVAQVYQEIAAAILNETSATTLTTDDGEDLPVVIVKNEDQQLTRDTIASYTLTVSALGETQEIPLSEIAEITEADGLTSISRYNQRRTLTVSAEIADGYNIGLVSRSLQRSLDSYPLPDGYTMKIAGENETIQNSLGDLLKMIGLAVILIYLIMVAQFQSLLSPFIVMFTIPLAFTGGLLALWASGFEISIVAMIGFLVLAGVVVNNGIVFVDFTNQLRQGGMRVREALVAAGKARIRPILMTALTTILGLLTLAFGVGQGSDMLQPMAVVTIGGLTYATFLTLFLVPVLYDLFHRRARRREAAAQE